MSLWDRSLRTQLKNYDDGEGKYFFFISRGFLLTCPPLCIVIVIDNLLYRDPRNVERKKPGQKKARKKYQWVKR